MPKEYDDTEREIIAQWHGLRLGTIPLNAFLHSIGCHPTSMCECERSDETVEHFLMRCERTKIERAHMVSEIKERYGMVTDPDIQRVLSTDSRSFTAVRDFLRKATRFKDQPVP